MPKMSRYGPPRDGLETACLEWLSAQPEGRTYSPTTVAKAINYRPASSISSSLSSLRAKGFLERPETGKYRAIRGAVARQITLPPENRTDPESSNGSVIRLDYPIEVLIFGDKVIVIEQDGSIQEVSRKV